MGADPAGVTSAALGNPVTVTPMLAHMVAKSFLDRRETVPVLKEYVDE